jgi:hypothetical protein
VIAKLKPFIEPHLPPSVKKAALSIADKSVFMETPPGAGGKLCLVAQISEERR